ncbi:tnf receptor-associated factor 2 [Plakobranchus ocellatus]|uniref:Tnf receptor-associated factor 2 n=1 Tax=Plakobranchus ocellatus TaxID=259542 RepID=A0AAV4BRA3_9GAST|nr:tnf receptor-associated factor 2 [Plakobranchus ocellatus]
MSSAEEGLMALLEAMLTLAAREARRPKPPPVKPGGHPEEYFTDLTEEEKEEFTCSICYQILKECMQCVNNHKFCNSCLIVWSTTGQYANRIRCPVCRTHGYYFRNSELDDRIGDKKVKCLMESCSWTGLLKHLATHRHTTYSGASNPGDTDTSSGSSMPRLAQASPRLIPSNSSRFIGTGLTTQGRADTFPTPRSSNVGVHASPSSLNSSASQESIIELPVRTTRTLTLNNNRPPPIRRAGNVRNATGPNRITFNHTRPGTDNNNNVEDRAGSVLSNMSSSTAVEAGENSSPTSFSSLPHAPRPPSAPRTAANSIRRLPRIVNPPTVRPQGAPQPIRRYQPPETISLSMSMPGPRGRPTGGATASGVSGSLGEIRERLQESRNRLDNLMTSFSGELERSRAQVSEFASQRERQRQDQLEEVRELGQRLGQVAAELRRLLEHRRDAAALLSDDSSSDNEEDEY